MTGKVRRKMKKHKHIKYIIIRAEDGAIMNLYVKDKSLLTLLNALKKERSKCSKS